MGSSVSHETLYSHNDDGGHSYYAVFKEDYFEMGACRYAFKGTLHGEGPRDGSNCVVKIFKKKYAKHRIHWTPDLAASKKAARYASFFMKQCVPILNKAFSTNFKLEFLIPLIAKMQVLKRFYFLWFIPFPEDKRYVLPNEYVALEHFMNGTYKKFNSNSGYEDNSGWKELMATFCHWTWHISGHKYMVCDLQGIQNFECFILTDPAIHSHDGRFGMTDQGVLGMEMVLSNHKCGMFCQHLNLENPLKGLHLGTPKKSTTYSFQVTEEEQLRKKGPSNYFQIMDEILE